MKTTILLLLISTLSIGQSYNWDSIALETQKKLDINESIVDSISRMEVMNAIKFKDNSIIKHNNMTDLQIADMLADYHKECELAETLREKADVQLKHARLIREALHQPPVSGNEVALPFDKVTRLEVISYREGDKSGRVFTHWKDDNKIEGQLQDKDRTLKIFIDKR
jgi:hypothetical protein